MGSRRPSPPNITFPPRGCNRPQPPRPQPPRPQPPRPEPPRPKPQPPRPEPTRPFDPVPQPPGGTRPQPPRPRPILEPHRDIIRPRPSKPEPTRPDMPGFVPPRRFPDGRPDRPRPTGFFDPRRIYTGPRGPQGQPPRRRRMAGERPMVVERVTTEAPRRPRFREDDTMSRDFEGFRQRRPKRDVNIAQQDV